MANVQKYQEIYIKDLKNNLNDLYNEKSELNKSNLTLYDYAYNYNVIDFILGTIIGISITYIIKDISNDIIGPILKYTVFKNNETIEINGIVFNIEKIVGNLIFAILAILILYLLFKLLNSITAKIVVENKNITINVEKKQLVDALYQSENIKLLNEINNKLTK